ncbi:hypothetical protein Godav_008699 [Gossypium davidsonii]|uniref:Uncharacterized protein n=1 Tax=Gossypium davidsonii TaxID=34287 RepID=A0A7J8SAU9_GOSDV|nr:hypothetical protein [Gossypium davidsonii]
MRSPRPSSARFRRPQRAPVMGLAGDSK